jgi:HSP20 family protein
MATRDKSKRVSPANWNPWVEMSWPHRLGRFLEGGAWNPVSDSRAPAGSLEETDDAYIVELDLPGVDKDNVSIDVIGRRVSVHGNRTEKNHDGVLRHSTVMNGPFIYEVTLPSPIEEADSTATLKNGILTVTMPKDRDAKTTKVPIS